MKSKWLSRGLLALTLILSHLAVGVGAWNYVSMYYCGKYGGCSAPAWVGLLPAVPFAAGALVCLGIWVLCEKKQKS